MKAFISYCHADRDLMTKFRGHLTPLERKFGLTVFSDQEILPGAQWEKWIWDEFERSEIVFVLVSVEFIKSNFCFNREFRKAITRHKKKEAVVVPVILSPCAWQNVRELSQLKALPDDGEPIRGGRFRVLDKGFLNAMNGINKLLTALSLRRGRKANRRPPKPSVQQYKGTSYRAALFDFDGTLVRGRVGHEHFRYSWELVWAHLGYPDSDRRKYYRQYVDKRITYEQWCNITLDLFRSRGLLKSHFLQIARKVRLTKNCKETLRILRHCGIHTAIVSGGIDTFLEAVFPDYSDYFDHIFINKFHYDDSGLLESIQTTPYDFEGKYDAIVHVCKQYGIKESECVFVGEGRNDLHAVRELSRAGGLTIGYPPELLVDYVDHSLWKDRLDAILDLMFEKPRLTPELPGSK